MTRIGVLALQGAFVEHIDLFSRLGATVVDVRRPDQLPGLDGLIIPGGESTTMSLLMSEYGLVAPVTEMARQGLPIWGTCAGMIMLARPVPPLAYPTLGLMDARVKRNAFGRQVDSFEADLDIAPFGPPAYHAVFIRAPKIVETGPDVEVLARLNGGTPVAARQGRLLATAFHPELTDDLRFHRLFLEIVADGIGKDPDSN